MKRFFFRAVILSIFIFSFGIVTASNTSNEKTVKILTIGNSFADNACTYLKQIAESVDWCNIIIGKANIGGCSLEKHANLIKACKQDTLLKPYGEKYSLKDLMLKENWDVVTIQQVSHLSLIAETYRPYANEIVAFIKKHAPQAQIYIHETWAYAPDCQRLGTLKVSRVKMHKRLKKNYKDLAKDFNVPILPSGNAFYTAYKRDSKIDLWNSKDRFHANSNGCFLAGCAWFGKLFDVSPKDVGFIPKEMDEATAEFLKKIADKMK